METYTHTQTHKQTHIHKHTHSIIMESIQRKSPYYASLLHHMILKAVANDPVGQVLARPLFVKVKTKFHFTKSKS